MAPDAVIAGAGVMGCGILGPRASDLPCGAMKVAFSGA